ncbi:MAG: hybrid sensor histidine kinase/response regulator [Verrucomicrobiota bacterium JB022]|nr:hybrid sensor histidine kinase/response regulator [Verrucomicrobiota bacterium JB022]
MPTLAEKTVSPAPTASPTGEQRPSEPKQPLATVLIVDDAPANLTLLEGYLCFFNYGVRICERAEEALQAAKGVDIILLDVLMPGLSGFELCKELKADPATREIPVIFMTALGQTTNKVKGFELGAVDYITKPLNAEEVLARVRTHLTLRQLQKDLQNEVAAKNRAISDLDAYAHTVAHDLKGPLNNIAGFSQLLAADAGRLPTEKVEEFSRLVHKSTLRLGNIIDELLLLASVRQEDAPLEPVDMQTIFEQTCQRMKQEIDAAQVEFELPTAWSACLGYGPWLEEVWANFLGNALKYAGQPPRVRIVAETRPEGIYYAVEDNGNGLSPEQCERLFRPFERLDRTRAQGHGLGLSIVKRIVEKLGGEVGVESPGRGTRFYFLLKPVERLPQP